MKFRTIFLFVVLAVLMLAGVAWAEDDVGGSGTVSAPGSLPVIEDLFLNDNGELIIKGSNLYTEEAFPIVTVDGYPIKVIHKSPTQLIVQLNAAQEGITTVTVITHPNDNNVVLGVIRTATAFIDTACDDKGCTQISLVYDDILHSHIQPNYLYVESVPISYSSRREWCRQHDDWMWVCGRVQVARKKWVRRCWCQLKNCEVKPCLAR